MECLPEQKDDWVMKTTKLRNDYTQFKNKVSDICTDTWDNYVHTEPVAFHADMKSCLILHEQQWLRTGTNCSHTIPLAQPRKNYLHNSFCYSGAVLWNSFPEIVRQAESPCNFKSLLHGYYNIK